MIDAGAERGDEAQIRSYLGEQRCIDAVGDGRDQHVGLLDGGRELRLTQRQVVEVETRHEQLHHARLDRVGQLARDDDERLFRRHLPSFLVNPRHSVQPAVGTHLDPESVPV